MKENGATAAMMSGSGPSVFGVFADMESAQRAACALTAQNYFAAVVSPVSKREI